MFISLMSTLSKSSTVLNKTNFKVSNSTKVNQNNELKGNKPPCNHCKRFSVSYHIILCAFVITNTQSYSSFKFNYTL